MEIVTTTRELRARLDAIRADGGEVALVPTMGALHAGHMSLVKLAKDRGCYTVLSIFVNPLQFNDKTDLEKYPRTLESDTALAAQHGADLVFAPPVEEIYPQGLEHARQLKAGSLAAKFDGEFRPGHFDGVVTVVATLLRIVKPALAIFGEKDFQQLQVIRQMVSEQALPVEIMMGALRRDPDGLAMSSRNRRLNPEQRQQALRIPAALNAARERFSAGDRNARSIKAVALNLLSASPALKVDYFEIVDPACLTEVSEITSDSRIILAVWVDGVRLIDTASFETQPLKL